MANTLTAMVANTPVGFPMAVTFKRYHMLHHRVRAPPATPSGSCHCYNVTLSVLLPQCYIIRVNLAVMFDSIYFCDIGSRLGTANFGKR